MYQIPLYDQHATNGRREVLDQSQVNKNQSEGQQDHRTIIGNLHKTTQTTKNLVVMSGRQMVLPQCDWAISNNSE